MINDFFERNKSVFIIGFITFIIFLSIIVISEIRRIGNDSFGPVLIRLEGNIESETAESSVAVKADATIDDFVFESSGTPYSLLPEEEYLQTDQKFGTMRVEYTDNGFVPVNAKAVLNQKVKWINNTGQNIHIKQKTAFFREFEDPILIPANGVFEFRLYQEGIWTYDEQTTILKP
jgi:hypothetical protein